MKTIKNIRTLYVCLMLAASVYYGWAQDTGIKDAGIKTDEQIVAGTEHSFTWTAMPQTRAAATQTIIYTVWNFGDGTVKVKEHGKADTRQVVAHTYRKAGNYTLTVKAYADSGLEVEDERRVFELRATTAAILPVNPNVHMFR